MIKWAIINRAVEKIYMKRIKLGLLMGAVLMSSVTLASDPKETMKAVSEVAVGTFELFKEVNDVDPLKDYDYDKNVPPSVDVLTTQVGEKDELEIFVPKMSLRYISYFIVDHKDARDYRTKYYNGLGNDVKSEENPDATKRGFANPATINKMTFYKNGILVNINVKDSPYTEFAVGDFDSTYDIRYTYGHGYVMKAELVTNTKSAGDAGKIDYVVNEYKTALKNKGYSYESLFGYFQESPLYAKDETVIAINVYKSSMAERIIYNYKYDKAVMVITNKEVFNNYEKIEADIKKKDYDVEFTKLGRILNN
jgi:hypothetical protein